MNSIGINLQMNFTLAYQYFPLCMLNMETWIDRIFSDQFTQNVNCTKCIFTIYGV